MAQNLPITYSKAINSNITYPDPVHPDPIQERVGLGIFTDREREMTSLMEWVEMVAQKYGRSQALVSHRRYGKTAIMERLYNRLFWERDDVMPFYFEIHDGIHKIWMKELAELYLYSFLQQFLAYRNRDAGLAFSGTRSFEHLYAIAKEAGETLVMEKITWWKEDTSVIDTLKIDEILQDLPHDFAVKTGLSIIVMFDEFQRLNQVLYYDEALTHQCLHYTDTFSRVAESSRAPMLIAGSQVTLLTEEALTGAMLGRVSAKYVERLPLTGAVELVFKFAQRRKWDIPLELAYLMSHLVDGHPYYIWCLFHSEFRERDLTTEEGIRNTLTFEVENRAGHINEFWRYHFAQNLETFNLPYARHMLLYLTQHFNDEVHVEKIVEDLDLPISVEETNDILQQLIWCDLIREESNQFYGGVSDPMLAWMLRIKYGWEIERLMRNTAIEQMKIRLVDDARKAKDELNAKLRGELNYWVGRFAEMFIDKLMKVAFRNQTVDGSLYFNRDDEIVLSRFGRVYTTMTQPDGALTPYQIDLYAIPQEEPATHSPLPWIVESKNWQTPVSKPDVEHFWAAAQNLAADREHSQFISWFYSRSGFSSPAEEFMQKKGMLYTDEAGLVQMLQDFQVVTSWYEADDSSSTNEPQTR